MKFLCIPCDEQMATQADGIMPKEKEQHRSKIQMQKMRAYDRHADQ